MNFGDIVDVVKEKHFSGVRVFEGKKQFSMLTEDVDAYFRSLERDTVILYGCETHICIK